jgi:hypothetical protein
MSPSETAKLLAVIAAAYPTFDVDELKVQVWADMIGDLDYRLANVALRRHIALSRFAPSIAEIREQAAAVAEPEGITGAEAWGELMEAIHRHGYYHEAEALASMSPETAQVATLIGWREINSTTEIDVLRGQFLRMYGQVRDRAKRDALLPPGLRPALPRKSEPTRIGEGMPLQIVQGGK